MTTTKILKSLPERRRFMGGTRAPWGRVDLLPVHRAARDATQA